jgi:hypothetical protein
MKWNKWQPLFAPADDYGFGGGFDDDDGDEVIDAKDLGGDDDDDEDDDLDDDDDDDDEGSSAKGRKAGSGGGFDHNALAQAITAGLKPVIGQQNGTKQMTREELEAHLGKPQVTADLIKILRDPETPPEKAQEVFAELLNKQTEYLLKASGLAIEGQVGKLSPQLESIQQWQRSQQEEKLAVQVAKKFPALRGKGNVVKQAMAYLQQQGYRPASQSDALRTIGRTTRDIIRQFDPNFSLKSKEQRFIGPRAGGGSRSSGGAGRKGGASWMAAFPVQ